MARINCCLTNIQLQQEIFPDQSCLWLQVQIQILLSLKSKSSWQITQSLFCDDDDPVPTKVYILLQNPDVFTFKILKIILAASCGENKGDCGRQGRKVERKKGRIPKVKNSDNATTLEPRRNERDVDGKIRFMRTVSLYFWLSYNENVTKKLELSKNLQVLLQPHCYFGNLLFLGVEGSLKLMFYLKVYFQL